jgi:hypothetical protein
MKAVSKVSETLGLSPKAPTLPTITPQETKAPTVNEARQAVETRDEMLRKRGRRASVLTGEQGVQNGGSVRKTTLLGN